MINEMLMDTIGRLESRERLLSDNAKNNREQRISAVIEAREALAHLIASVDVKSLRIDIIDLLRRVHERFNL